VVKKYVTTKDKIDEFGGCVVNTKQVDNNDIIVLAEIIDYAESHNIITV